MTRARLLASLALLAALTDAVPTVTNLHSTNQTLNTVTLAWDLDPPSPQPWSYTLSVDGLLQQFYAEWAADSTYAAEGLKPCQTYHFELWPTYKVDDGGVEGLSDTTTAATEYMTPEGTSDLSYDEASNTLTWTEPSNAMCVDHYSVCWRSQMTSETSCVESTQPSLSLDMLSGCDNMTAVVKAVGPDGKEGPIETIKFATAYGAPGEVEALEIYTTLHIMVVIWRTISDGCVDHFKICYRDFITLEEKCIETQDSEQEKSIVLTDLGPCQYYEVTVSAVSITGEIGPATPQLVRMQDTAPGSVTNLAAHEVTTHSLLVSYDPPTENPACALRYVESLLLLPPQPSAREAGLGPRRRKDPTTAQPPNCTLTSPGANRGSSENHVNDLESCSNYQITVYAISPSQQAGPPTQVEQSTLDEAPLEPSELKTVAKTSSTIAVSWFAPSNRFCVSWYKIRADTEEVQSEEVTIFEDYFAFERTHALSNLAACTEYTVVVQAGNHLGTAEASYQESTLC